MAINNKPIFTGTPAIGVFKFTEANCATKQKIFPITPASASEGVYIQKIRIKLSSGANVNPHVFETTIFNGISTYGIYDTLLIPSSTFSNTSTSSIYEIPMNIALPNGFSLYSSFTGTISGSFTFDAIVFGGTYAAQ